ncbi:MAG: CGNR zinc finger domain-containing protein [Actinomycetes bacterium]
MELVGNALCLDFTNTVNSRPHPARDELATAHGAVDWAQAVGLSLRSPPRAQVEEVLKQLRGLRETVFAVFSATAGGGEPPRAPLRRLVDAYSTALGNATWHRDSGTVVPEWSSIRRLPELAWPVSASAMHLLTGGPLDRVRSCPSCGWLFLDVSKNGLRRWCSMATCGSRTKSARYFARTKGHLHSGYRTGP